MSLKVPLKQRRICLRIPYIVNDRTLVYGCEQCVKQHDLNYIHWLWLGKQMGLPRDLVWLIAGKIEKLYVEWERWEPKTIPIGSYLSKRRAPVRLFVLRCNRALLSRFCCHNPYTEHMQCICGVNEKDAIWQRYLLEIEQHIFDITFGDSPVQTHENYEYDLFLQ